MNIKTILLYPNRSRRVNKADFETVEKVLAGFGYKLFTNDVSFADGRVNFLPTDEAFSVCDAAIVLGGDGTMLAAAHHARKTGIPLLGINFGTLGYMTELEIGEVDLLSGLQDARIEERMLLDVSVSDGKSPVETRTALNEAAISRAKPGTMIRLHLFCDGCEVCSYRADGMIISTPTGSSAYNLSAGGPIIDPKMNAFCVAPLAPHTLSTVRPIVFSPDSVIRVEVEGEVCVASDSELFPILKHGGCITVRQSDHAVKLLKLKNAGFYDVLMKKLT